MNSEEFQGTALLTLNNPKTSRLVEKVVIDLELSYQHVAIDSLFERIEGQETKLVVIETSACSLEKALETITAIRTDSKLFKTPVILISDDISNASIQASLKSGVTEYIVPPLIKHNLQLRFENALKLPLRNNNQYFVKSTANSIQPLKTNFEEITVLIVDDVSDNIEVGIGALSNDFHLKAAKNADTAMRICLSDNPPDIILLDIMMPGVDGLTFCKQLKHNPLTSHIAIIFLTALSSTQDILKGLELGAVDYLTKPVQPELLQARVKIHAQLILAQHKLQAKINALEAN